MEIPLITLRLDPELEQSINQVAHQMGVSKSELIRKSITEFIDKRDKPSAWKLGQDVFGKYTSIHESLSRDRKTLIKDKIRAKK